MQGAQAQTRYYWKPTISGSKWSNPSNWKTGSCAGSTASTTPSPTDTVFIGGCSATTCNLDTSITIARLVYEGSNVVTINTSGSKVISLTGDLLLGNTSTTGGGSATIKFTGTGSQSITSTVGVDNSKLPNITIDKSSGTLSLSGTITIGGSSGLTLTNGTVSYGTSRVDFYFNNTISGKIPFYDVVFEGTNSTCVVSDTITVNDSLITNGSSKITINTGYMDLYGNLSVQNTSTSSTGTAIVRLRGTNNQTLSATPAVTAGEGALSKVWINKSSGTVHMKGILTLVREWKNNYSHTSVNTDSSTVYLNGSTQVVGGTFATDFWNLKTDYHTGTSTLTLDTAVMCKVLHDFVISGNQNFSLNGGTLELDGDVYANDGPGVGGGTATLKFGGSNSQTFHGVSSTLYYLPKTTIDKSGGTLYLRDTMAVGRNFTYAGGTVDATTYGSTFYFSFSSNNITLTSDVGSHKIWFNHVILGTGANLGSTLNVAGNLDINHNTRVVTNSDSINVKGNLSLDHASISLSSSVVTFTGSNSQALNGSDSATFYKVIMNKSSNSLTLSRSLTISNSLTLTNGNIISSASHPVIINDNATASGASDASFVSGPIRKVGNDAFTFPTGKSSQLHQIAITAPSSTSDAFTAEYFHSAYSSSTKDTSLNYISACEYWDLERTTGSSNIKVTLYWNSHTCDIYTLSTLRVARYDGGSSQWKAVTTATTSGSTGSGSIQTDNNQSTFGIFSIGKRYAAFLAHAGSDQHICPGGSIAIGGSPSATGGSTPYTYSWSPSSDLSSSTAANPTASPSSTGSYILTATDADLQTAKDTVIITIYSSPTAHAGSDVAICSGSGTSIGSAATGGASPYTYSWSPSTALSSTTVASPTASPTTTTSYIVTATDANTCTGKDTVTVTIHTLPSAHAGRDTSICPGTSTLLGATPVATGGSSPYSYLWTPGTELSSNTAANPTATPGTTTSFALAVTDQYGCIGRDTVGVSIYTLPVVTAGSDTAICKGLNTVLGGSPTASGGASPYTYLWSPSTDLSANNVANPTASPLVTRMYTVFVTDNHGCLSSDAIYIYVPTP